MMEGLDVLHVEVYQKMDSSLAAHETENLAYAEISALEDVALEVPITGNAFSNEMARTHIDSITCSCSHSECCVRQKSHMKTQGATLKFHVYRLTAENAAVETIENDSEDLAAYSHWVLPSKEFYQLWENLYFNSSIKQDLLHFVETTMIFAEHSVDPNIISCNKVIFLYGPPGTGKTSMCQALAQKISIRLSDRYTHGELLEINSNSLFSKWFSESGKLVMKLFDEIHRHLQNPKALVCILINEIESLAHMRKTCTNGSEPTDAIRVVNALLTQLDQIKHYPNVVIMTTSNLMEAVDLAFVDRADIKEYIGHPNEEAIYKIYTSCLKELMRAKLMEQEAIFDLSYLKQIGYNETNETANSIKLMELCRKSVGMSGRTLRKIPFLAHALHLRSKKCTLSRFLRAMYLAVQAQDEKEES